MSDGNHHMAAAIEGLLGPKGREVFEQEMGAQRFARTMARREFAAEVSGIIGTLSVHKPPMQVINELIALCRKQAE